MNLKDPSELSKKSEEIYIKPGEIKDIKVNFPVNRWEVTIQPLMFKLKRFHLPVRRVVDWDIPNAHVLRVEGQVKLRKRNDKWMFVQSAADAKKSYAKLVKEQGKFLVLANACILYSKVV